MKFDELGDMLSELYWAGHTQSVSKDKLYQYLAQKTNSTNSLHLNKEIKGFLLLGLFDERGSELIYTEGAIALRKKFEAEEVKGVNLLKSNQVSPVDVLKNDESDQEIHNA